MNNQKGQSPLLPQTDSPTDELQNLRLEIIQLTHDAIKARKAGNLLLAEIFLALRVLWIAEVNRLKAEVVEKDKAA